MAGKKSGSLLSTILISLVSAVFVAFIAWGSFSDGGKILIAAAITFGVVFLALLVLRLLQKDDDIKPGVPRLK